MVRVNRVRRIIRKVDPWTVLKVSFVFNFIISLTIVLGFSILWVLLVNAGVPQGLEEIARRLALLDDNASLVGNVEVLFSSVLFFANASAQSLTILSFVQSPPPIQFPDLTIATPQFLSGKKDFM